MIAPRVPTQAEVDRAVLEKFGISPTGQYTSDGSQQLYKNKEGKGFTLPASVDGYSAYMIEDIVGHLDNIASGAKVVGIHKFTASEF